MFYKNLPQEKTMAKRDVLLVIVDKRNDSAVNVQKTLTAWGCIIKTRLGIHDGVVENCSETGLIFCELAGDVEKHEELNRKLNILKGVTSKLVSLEL